MAKFTWVLKDVSKLTEAKIYSPNFELEGFTWRYMIFPKGNRAPGLISIYLECVPEGKEAGWKCNAQFQLTIVNHLNLKKSIRQDSSHLYRAGATDWGFAKFAELATLFNAENGFIRDDSLTLFVELEALQSSASYYSWDSRKETGFVGIRNQGATCYMNSLLQTMYFNCAFRKAVYSLPTQGETAAKSIGLALQRLFFSLQSSDEAAGTEELTKSFGWDSHESFTQHDVQELNRVLLDNLETKFKGTPADGIVNKLFAGSLYNYIKCINVDYSSTRTEAFLDISLNVRGMRNVYDAFDAFIAEETLDGTNQYSTETFGKQDAKKGIRFEAFPPVLNLHLKRFEFDYNTGRYSKINDRFEYPSTLELDKYLSETADRSVPQTFDLYGVLIHSGGAQGGHYYAFCRPTSEPRWFKFDDDRVSMVKEKEAVAANYGMSAKDSLGAVHRFRSLRLSRRFTTAYLLVYLRRSDVHWLMESVSDDAVPAHVRDAVQREAAEAAENERMRRDAHLFSTIRVIRDRDLLANKDPDIANISAIEPVKVKTDASLAELMRLVSEADGVPADSYRLWSCVHRENGSLRPTKLIPREVWTQPIGTHLLMYRGWNDLKCYAQRLAPGEAELLPPGSSQAYVKLFDAAERSLVMLGPVPISASTTAAALFPLVAQRASLPADTVFEVFEEVTTKAVERVEPARGLSEASIGNGDILVFQKADTLGAGTIDAFYAFLATRLRVTFKDLKKPETPDVVVDLVQGMDYDQVTNALGAKISAPGPNIRLTQLDLYTKRPKFYPAPRIYSTYVTPPKLMLIQDLLYSYAAYGQTARADTLFYEVLEMPLVDFENMVKVDVDYWSAEGKFDSKHTLLVDKTGTIADLLAKFREVTAATPGAAPLPAELRLVELNNHKVSKVYGLAEPMRTLASYYSYRIEPVHPDDAAAPAGSRLCFFNHYVRNSYHTILDPLVMMVGAGETTAQLKVRLRARLGMSEEQFAKIKLVYCSFSSTQLLEDDAIAVPANPFNSDWFGLKHDVSAEEAAKLTMPAPTASRYTLSEKAIKIYN